MNQDLRKRRHEWLKPSRHLVFQVLVAFCFVFVLSACDGNYLVWSSDGKYGAAIGAKGLRITDAEGVITPVLLDAGIFRWMPQEHQGFVVSYDYAGSWAELKGLLTDEQQKQVIDESAKLKKRVYSYKGDQKKFAESTFRTFAYPLEAVLHLRANSDPDFKKLAQKKWRAFQSVKVPVFVIKQVQIEDKSARVLRVIDRGIDEVAELRVSPNGKFLACVKHEHAKDYNYIQIIPLRAFAKPTTAAVATNIYPDWSADGRFLYYARLNGRDDPDLLPGANIHEGVLCRQEIGDNSNSSQLPGKAQKLARLIFDPRLPIRVLKDGRVFFSSRELRLPSSTNAGANNRLFFFDAPKVESLFHKTDDLVYFELSPDQEHLAVTTSNGSLYVIKTNGTGEMELCNGKDLRISGILPQWRSTHELSFGAEQPAPKGSKPVYSVLLYNSNQNNSRDLSKAWGKEAASEILVHRDIFQEAMGGVIRDIEKSDKGK